MITKNKHVKSDNKDITLNFTYIVNNKNCYY